MANLHGDFLLEMPESNDEIAELPKPNEEFDIDLNYLLNMDDEMLETIDMGQFDGLFSASTVSSEIVEQEMSRQLKMPTMPELSEPETPSYMPSAKRFKSTNDDEMEKLFQARQAPATKKNTIWGLKIFQDWNIETCGREVDMENVQSVDLAQALKRFYCEARPKPKPNEKDEVYHKNTLINIRGAINRHLTDLKRNIDIVRDKEFKTANGVLDGLLKLRTRTGQSKPTKHKSVIEPEDLQKISTYLEQAPNNPIILRQCVWFNLSIHFVSRGLEFHHQLTLNSFEFHNDESGEYVTLAHETQQKNHQGGMFSVESSRDKRMYAEPESNSCPVAMLKLLIKKTDPRATQLFNQYTKESTFLPLSSDSWYTSKGLSKRSFEKMSEICKSAGVEKKYTPHCLRATAVEHLDHDGFQARHIMFMSDHRNESSLRPYNRSVSSSTKRALSQSLSAICQPSSSKSTHLSLPCNSKPAENTTPCSSDDRSLVSSVSVQSTNNIMSTPGFFANSTFNNCSFSFNK